MIARAIATGNNRFEWVFRRVDTLVPRGGSLNVDPRW